MTRLVQKTRLKQSMSALRSMLEGSSTFLKELQRSGDVQAKPVKQKAPVKKTVLKKPQVHKAELYKEHDTKKPDRFEYHNYKNVAGHRRYKLFTPSVYKGQSLPLIIMMHGCTQSPEDFAAGTQMNQIAEEKGFFVAYPEQIKAANISKCWNWFNAKDQKRDEGEASIIAGITRQIIQTHEIDKSRVYITGLSAGGAFAAIMGAAYPDLFAAIGVHSGLASGSANSLVNAMSAMRHGSRDTPQFSGRKFKSDVPVIVFHGDMDNTVHSINGDQVVAQSNHNKAFKASLCNYVSERGLKYTVSSEINAEGKTMLEHWVLHGAGHAWSGGSPAESYTEPRGPDASREMVRFFLQHKRL